MAAGNSPRLTVRQAKAYELRTGDGKLSWRQIGERMGVAKSNAAEAYSQALVKIERFGLEACTPPGCSLPVLSEEVGLDGKFQTFVKGLKNGVSNELFVSLLEKGLLRAFWIMAYDASVFERLNAKELALLIGHLTETRQLLKGEPTKIVSVEDRRHWDELGVALLQEVERRNLKYDLPPGQFQEIVQPTPLNNG